MFVCKPLLFILGLETIVASNNQGFIKVHEMSFDILHIGSRNGRPLKLIFLMKI